MLELLDYECKSLKGRNQVTIDLREIYNRERSMDLDNHFGSGNLKEKLLRPKMMADHVGEGIERLGFRG